MRVQEFLAAVLPEEGSGFFCATELDEAKRHQYSETIEGLKDATDRLVARHTGAYYALATFTHPTRRQAENAAMLRSVFVDLDCGPDEVDPETGVIKKKAFLTKRAAVLALQQFLQETGLDKLGRPWLVDSGGGVHVYFPMRRSLPVAQWHQLAVAFKNTAHRLGFAIDMSVTSDAARVLRVPDSFNYKKAEPRAVLLRQVGDFYEPEAFADCLDAYVPPAAAKPHLKLVTPTSPLMQALTQNHATYFKDIAVRTAAGTGCGQLKHYMEHATEDGMEPLWRAMMSLANKCEDGEKAILRLTQAHPYSIERMNAKLAALGGPYSCAKIDEACPGICTKCQHFGKITNPLALGRRLLTENDPPPKHLPPLPATSETLDSALTPVPSTQSEYAHAAPLGFSYGLTGGVYKTVQEKDANGNSVSASVVILPYSLFLVDLSKNVLGEHHARFAIVRSDKSTVRFLHIPMSALATKDSLTKILYSANILGAYGAGNDVNLCAYIRACVEAASVLGRTVDIPPRMGWQDNGAFVIGDTVINPKASGEKSYTFASESLKNIIATTKTSGTLEGWREYVSLIQKKGLYDVLGLMSVSFGAPLMQFAGDGTPAMLLHACGKDSGSGKSTALRLAASVWGDPFEFPVRPTTSSTTVLQRVGLMGNLPLLMDEVTSVQRKSSGMKHVSSFISEMAFDLSQGGHKLKGSASANSELQNDLFWRTLGLLTSNEPAMEKMLTQRETTSDGELRRMLEWHAVGTIAWTDEERLLADALSKNFGGAGRKFIEWVVDNAEVAAKVTQESIEWVRLKLRAPDTERFYFNGLGPMLAGMVLCGSRYADVFEFDVRAIFKQAFAQWVYAARRLQESHATNAEDILDQFISERNNDIVRFAKNDGPQASFLPPASVKAGSDRGHVVGRVETGVREGLTEVFIAARAFKAFCGRFNRSYETVCAELKETYTVDVLRKDLLARTGGASLYVQCLRFTRLSTPDDTNTPE